MEAVHGQQAHDKLLSDSLYICRLRLPQPGRGGADDNARNLQEHKPLICIDDVSEYTHGEGDRHVGGEHQHENPCFFIFRSSQTFVKHKLQMKGKKQATNQGDETDHRKNQEKQSVQPVDGVCVLLFFVFCKVPDIACAEAPAWKWWRTRCCRGRTRSAPADESLGVCKPNRWPC